MPEQRARASAALLDAARSGRTSAARGLLHCVDVNCRGVDGATPLTAAAAAGHAEVARFLLAAHADANLRGLENQTPLFLAARAGHRDVVRALLDAGADKRLANARGSAPIDVARTEEIWVMLASGRPAWRSC